MAYEKVTDRSELTSADDLDVLHVVDVSDTTLDAAGNSKKITVSNLMNSAPVQSVNGSVGAVTGLATETYVDTAVGTEETARIAGDASLQTQVSDNDADITALDTRVTSNEGDIVSLDSRVTTSEGDIGSLQTQVTGNDNDISSLDTRVTTNEGDITTLNTNTSTNASNITALDGRMTTAEGDIAALEAATYVNTVNGVDGAVTIAAGSNVTVSTAGQTITISSSGGGGGGGNTFTDIDGVTADSGSQDVDFVASTGISITPNNTAKTITFAVSGLETDDVTEAGNQYYTEARVSANASVVANTAKNSYPTADANKLAGIEDGAEVNHLSTDELTEGNTNLYYTAGRVLTAIQATSVTALNDVTNAGSGAIITATERTKLAGIEDGAEVNVQSDWDATTGDAFILNKPSIPTDLTDLGDTPATLGSAGQVLAVATGGTTTEWVDQSGGTSLTDTDDLPEGSTNFYYADSLVNTYLVAQKIRANYPTGTYTGNTAITATHEQTMMVGNSATGITFQVSSGLARDCEILVMQYGAGDITITGATGVTIRTSSDFQAVTGGRYAIIGLKQIGTTDEYIVTGERKSA